jgi:sulfur relay (sulfurtransferase) complex TusBCD TusD component (DsrE family)
MATRGNGTVFIFTAYGMGQTENPDLRLLLTGKFLGLLAQSDTLPSQICFYTDGVRLCVHGSPVLAQLQTLQDKGVELALCSTCLGAFGLANEVAVGVVGGMGDIITAMMNAAKVVTL